MEFKEWLKKEEGNIDTYNFPEESLEMAWNAAAVAVELAEHSDDDSGHCANCNAMMAVEKLKSVHN